MYITNASKRARYSSDLDFLTGGRKEEHQEEMTKMYLAVKNEDIIFKFYNLRTKKTVTSIDKTEPYFIKACVRNWNTQDEDDKKRESSDRRFNQYSSNDAVSWFFHNHVFNGYSTERREELVKKFKFLYGNKFSSFKLEKFIDSVCKLEKNKNFKLDTTKKREIQLAIDSGFNPYAIKLRQGFFFESLDEQLTSESVASFVLASISWAKPSIDRDKLNGRYKTIDKQYLIRKHHAFSYLGNQSTLEEIDKLYELNPNINFMNLTTDIRQFSNDEVCKFIYRRLIGNRTFALTCNLLSCPSFLSEYAFELENFHLIPKSSLKKAFKRKNEHGSNDLIEALLQMIDRLDKDIYEFAPKIWVSNIWTLLKHLPKKYFKESLFVKLKKINEHTSETHNDFYRDFFHKFDDKTKEKYQKEMFDKFPAFFWACTESFKSNRENYLIAVNQNSFFNFHDASKKFSLEKYSEIIEAMVEAEPPHSFYKKFLHEEFYDLCEQSGFPLRLRNEDYDISHQIDKDELNQWLKIILNAKIKNAIPEKGIKTKKLKI